MKVKLISFTKNPLEVIYWAFMNMHHVVPDSIENINLSSDEKESFFSMLIKQPHQTVFEFVNLVWLIEGASRAFQQQLTRTRTAAYSIQSLRIVDVGDFASEKRFAISEELNNNAAALKIYRETMEDLQSKYRELIRLGCKTEDARGLLPLNIHSTITMAINLRSLYHMLELRFCENAQGEFREVARLMRAEIREKISPILSEPMKPLCFRLGKCISPVPCGKYDFPVAIDTDISRWVKR